MTRLILLAGLLLSGGCTHPDSQRGRNHVEESSETACEPLDLSRGLSEGGAFHLAERYAASRFPQQFARFSTASPRASVPVEEPHDWKVVFVRGDIAPIPFCVVIVDKKTAACRLAPEDFPEGAQNQPAVGQRP